MEVPDKKKNIKGIIAIFIAAVVLIGAVIFVNAYSPTARVGKLMDLGQKYLSEFNYEKAIAAFEQALEIDPKNEEMLSSLSDAYLAWATTEFEKGNFESGMEILRKGLERTGSELLARELEQRQKSLEAKQEDTQKDSEHMEEPGSVAGEKTLESFQDIWELVMQIPYGTVSYLPDEMWMDSVVDVIGPNAYPCSNLFYSQDRYVEQTRNLVGNLEEYRAFLTENGYRENADQLAGDYLDYDAACQILRLLYLQMNELDKAKEIWKEILAYSGDWFSTVGETSVSESFDENNMPVFRSEYDPYGRECFVQQYSDGAVVGESKVVFRGINVESAEFRQYFRDGDYYHQIKRFYYDEEGRLSLLEIQYEDDHHTGNDVQSIRYTYLEDDKVRLDVEKTDDSGNVTDLFSKIYTISHGYLE